MLYVVTSNREDSAGKTAKSVTAGRLSVWQPPKQAATVIARRLSLAHGSFIQLEIGDNWQHFVVIKRARAYQVRPITQTAAHGG